MRVEGGWRLTGQKIWTSLAAGRLGHLHRPHRPGRAPHEGITYFLVDMNSPGVTCGR